MNNRIVVVGSINADLNVLVDRHPAPGETLLGSGGHITAGGKGANQAVAAALQGADVAFVGAVGKDPYAAPALEFLRSSGVDLTAVSEVDDTTGLAVITVAKDGENNIVVIPGANSLVNCDYVSSQSALLAEAGILLLQGEIPADGFKEAIHHTMGRVVVNLAPVIEVEKSALLEADPIIANEHEAGLILDQFGAGIDSMDPHELAQALLDAGFASVVLTLGSAGALVADATGITDIATPTVQAVDTTGAGDAFSGAFCARLIKGDSLIDAATHAARVGAYSVQTAGAQASYPDASVSLPSV
ncbi:ribokinase RbsK2 [Corynebacterium glutamicum]|uniref:ribokinase RbsK2 n=1 Tax=Corynebacterium glutamicum TaxID=1718 RepID=UPI000941F973|nr:ribokinase [Corynebacterium glutamicum]OKX85291.1 ribokinase [Corynebacterium glutamicum]QDX76185.1 ribokinase [Corynebacterium glutamicum]QDX78959.1 ribokinase [Corynebacterium glutamicum]QYR16883.1 ribokinase [Corynebacterium glutamicum]TWS31546.1 ribokinase [Corynebacterium glutamicum]